MRNIENKHIRVLHIEDNPDHTELVKLMLNEVDGITFDLECSDRLSAGLKRLAQGGIDVVLLDLLLLDSKGVDMFVRVNRQAPDVPVIVLGGFEDDIAVKAFQTGAQDYLYKRQTDRDLLSYFIRYAIEQKADGNSVEKSSRWVRNEN